MHAHGNKPPVPGQPQPAPQECCDGLQAGEEQSCCGAAAAASAAAGAHDHQHPKRERGGERR